MMKVAFTRYVPDLNIGQIKLLIGTKLNCLQALLVQEDIDTMRFLVTGNKKKLAAIE